MNLRPLEPQFGPGDLNRGNLEIQLSPLLFFSWLNLDGLKPSFLGHLIMNQDIIYNFLRS